MGRPWNYDSKTVDGVRAYLNIRYKLLPTLLEAGRHATLTGVPLAARGDFYWPQYKESTSNQQYIFLHTLLVAPIMSDKSNTRDVWVPPGIWENCWDGSYITGPQSIRITQPFERIPLWFRRDGSFLITANDSPLRVGKQDW